MIKRYCSSCIVYVVNFAWILILAVIIFNIALAFSGGWLIGVSTDEPFHVSRLKSFFDSGWYLVGSQIGNGVPKEGVSDAYVYGPIAALFSHLIAITFGAEQFGVVLASAEAYAARHIGIALISLCALAAVTGITRLMLGTWFWGMFAAALLSSLPLWTGHAMFNIKDIPVASGYAVYTLGILLIYQHVLKRRSWIHLTGAVLITFIGVIISMGTRPGMWVFLVASALAAYLFLNLKRDQKGDFFNLSKNLKFVFWIFVPFVVSYFVFLYLYPNAFKDPLVALWNSAFRSAHYNIWNGGWLTNGYIHGQPPPIWYWPAWLAHQTPIGILSLYVIGLFVSVITLFKFIKKNVFSTFDQVQSVGIFLILSQALLAPIMSIVIGSTVYSGTRQFLFIYPALSVLGTIGFYYLTQFVKQRLKLIPSLLLVALFLLAIISPTIDQWRLFPYSYAYLNEIATLKKIDGNWPTDYWRTSVRALLKNAEQGIPIDCRGNPPEPNRGAQSLNINDKWVKPYPSDLTWGCGNGSGRPYIRQPLNTSSYGKFQLIGVNRHGFRIPDNCVLVYEEKRILRGKDFIMGWISMCDVQQPIFDAIGEPLSVAQLVSHGGDLSKGWSRVEPWGVWSDGEFADISLRLGEGRKFVVELDALAFVPPKRKVLEVEFFCSGDKPTSVLFEQGVSKTIRLNCEKEPQHEYLSVTASISNPTSPFIEGQGVDSRRLGLGLKAFKIEIVK